jgi:hypothetical protein
VQDILPRLGKKFAFEIQTISKPRSEYQSAEYLKLGLPPAPAVMIEEAVVLQGPEVSEEKLEAALRRHLAMPL